MRSEVQTVDDYLKTFDNSKKVVLEELRGIIKELFPEIQESMKYGMPTYIYNNKIIAYASQKHYTSLYLQNRELITKSKEFFRRASFGSNCIRFKEITKQDLILIKELLKNNIA
ncbi:MAG TPA: DUF1801 domain-containing protein [Candidatus Bathyarchaeia archaeon]|nr:DUF1801 domain-containing protein [Candidatus Bathyarchaeia archaeon]